MDRLKAKALIDLQRRRWRSQATDVALARRAQRACLGLAVGWVAGGAGFTASAAVSGKVAPFLCLGLGQLIGSVFFFWQSRRFAQAGILLADA
jgi:hypothetical protein